MRRIMKIAVTAIAVATTTPALAHDSAQGGPGCSQSPHNFPALLSEVKGKAAFTDACRNKREIDGSAGREVPSQCISGLTKGAAYIATWDCGGTVGRNSGIMVHYWDERRISSFTAPMSCAEIKAKSNRPDLDCPAGTSP